MAEIGKLLKTNLTTEMKKAYLDYAMSVIVQRALPDVKDGLKPVHRRILFAMHEVGLHHSAKYKKSATVVGEVLGKYHPHGDVPVYDAMVRLAQDFAMRYPLIDGQGNFGCFTADTKIKITDGRDITFENLVEEHELGIKHFAFTFNTNKKEIEIAEIKNPRITRKNAHLVKVTLDNKTSIRCTPDHRFLLRNGTYKEAKDLLQGDSLMALYTKIDDGIADKNLKGYEMIYQGEMDKWQYTHHLADKWNLLHNVYQAAAGRIRHHVDINKLNNNPTNIQRLSWENHWKIHYTLASWRHKNDPEYVKKLAEGRRKYINENRTLLSERRSNNNLKLWKNPIYRKKRSEAIKALWQNPSYREYMIDRLSKRMKLKWQEKDFKMLMSNLKSKELNNHWTQFKYREKMTQLMKQNSLKMWKNNEHRNHISHLMKELYYKESWIKRQSEITKKLWQDPKYRAQFSSHHFSEMSKKMWKNADNVKLHQKKAHKQWENSEFRNTVIKSVHDSNIKRLQKNPQMMNDMAKLAKISLQNKWKDPQYNKKVMQSKINHYVSDLLANTPHVTKSLYEKKRTNQSIPKIESALKYYENFDDLLSQAKSYNHKVVSVVALSEREDTYDLTIDPWHNFALSAGVFVHNSIDGDPPAAMRYTEARMAGIADEMLVDLEKETVTFVPNFDASLKEPLYLPAKLPNLLLMGAEGIAVGMATKIPPHNLGELIDAIVYMISKTTIMQNGTTTLTSDVAVDELLEFVKGPDFPTAGSIYDIAEIRNVYTTGRGRILIRGKADIEDIGQGKSAIIITELPYQVNKAVLVARIAQLAKEKKIEGITDLRDESDRHGIRVVIELKRDITPKKVLNNLFKNTALQTSFSANVVALVDGTPQTLNLKAILEEYLKHRYVVIRRRSEFELRQAKARQHILDGLKIAVDHIDAVIQTIRSSADQEAAKKNLISKFKLSEIQAIAILDMQLRRLAALERQKIEDELKQVQATIAFLEDLLAHGDKILSVIKEELVKLKDKYADARRTKVYKSKVGEFSEEDLIPNEPTVITLTDTGYIKRQSMMSFKTQHRGGKGVKGMTTKDEDAIAHIHYAQTHDFILFFTNKGKVYQLRAFEISESQRTSKGTAIVNLLNIESGEVVESFITYKKDSHKNKNIFLTTRKGTVKKTKVSEFENIRRTGIVAIKLDAGDELVWSNLTDGDNDVMLITRNGKAIRFTESGVRPMGRATQGVRGIKLVGDDVVVGMDIIAKDDKKAELLVLTENGLGKRTTADAFRGQTRGGQGVLLASVTPKTGKVAVGQIVNSQAAQEIIITSKRGQVVKLEYTSVPRLSRVTQGVILMRFSNTNDKVVSATTINEID